MKRRDDIDGLRGVAVAAVVLYHAGIGPFASGYVGVDVFIVISGYVISMLLGELSATRGFSYSAYLARRGQRLFPPAVVAVAATLLASMFVLGPQDLVTLAKSSLASIVGASNLYFWGRLGYFADQVPEQALLHTWSLGLEAQFYLVAPMLLASMYTIKRSLRVLALGGLCVASLALNVWMTGEHPGAAFYLLPTRLWEFLLGALVALFQHDTLPSRAGAELISGLGAVGLVISVSLISHGTPYPGVAALIPVFSAASIIWGTATSRTSLGGLLRSRALNAIGRSSYSIYLWHWPAFAIARYYSAGPLTSWQLLAVFFLVGVLSYLSWRHLEPVWGRSKLTSKSVVLGQVAVLTSTALIPLCVIMILASGGLPSRLAAAALAYDESRGLAGIPASSCHFGPPRRVTEADLCQLAERPGVNGKLLLWGDSHGDAIAMEVAKLAALNKYEAWQATYSSCPPIMGVGVARPGVSRHCQEFNEMVAGVVQRFGITRVLLVAYWSSYLPKPVNGISRLLNPYAGVADIATGNREVDLKNLSAGLQKTISLLRRSGVQIWVMEQVPDQHGFVPLMLSRAVMQGQNLTDLGVALQTYREAQRGVSKIFAQFSGDANFIDPSDSLCQAGRCLCALGGVSLYRDSNHLTPRGAELLEGQLNRLFDWPMKSR